MSKRLPSLSARQMVRALEKAGFVELPDRGDGSHHFLVGGDPPRGVVVPDHRDLKRKTLSRILKQAGLTRDEFLALL